MTASTLPNIRRRIAAALFLLIAGAGLAAQGRITDAQWIGLLWLALMTSVAMMLREKAAARVPFPMLDRVAPRMGRGPKA